ncbi:MAG TPA: YbfB/YjiJ family MFS transporter, partial [Microlunatus sp.]|nr:YbfB/YjiJ family MFS transporter [Microlunatus sp.]
MVPGAAMIAVTFGLARYGYGLLLPDMRDELSLSSGAAGLIASGTYAAYLIANLAVVQVITRWG